MSKRKQTKTIAAERFELVDQKGRVRALLYASAWDGDPRFELFDKDGLGRLSFEVADGQPFVKFMNAAGQPLISIGVNDKGESRVLLSALDGSIRVAIEVDSERKASINVFGDDDTP
jgi:hypothetical protein